MDDTILLKVNPNNIYGRIAIEKLRQEGVPNPEKTNLLPSTDSRGRPLRLELMGGIKSLQGLDFIFVRAHGGRVIKIDHPEHALVLA
jgi:hypothetical protein